VQLLNQESSAFLSNKQKEIDRLNDQIKELEKNNPRDPKLPLLQNQLSQLQQDCGMGGEVQHGLEYTQF
jgi:DNA repair ATPase RecN